ncbi:DUF3987 domain-containing protein [Deminuibacter soli]|uniref:DUF3987 domain-containing protein n=1 Tax=Deminuibacter soli TaxID=2291815 RepID=A0A3E1NNU8_9BACT|nr:DUF3987 domain-containing protein [Deminuibacter soli]RFM29593.1 DUF3987 domain-containing protein [Deminuibacter soli]
MATATIFKGFNNPIENISLIILTNHIKEGKYKQDVEDVRALIRQDKKEEADKLKKQLLAFTPSATFAGGRKLEFLQQYSQFIILDLDKLKEEELQAAFNKAAAIPYTFCCFRSPGGNGLKILVEVTSTQEHHEQAYNQVADYYQQHLCLPVDRSGKDITRLCFISYDPETYRNISNEKFPVITNGIIQKESILPQPTKHLQTQTEEPNEYALAFEMQINFTNQKSQYEPNNRNNYIYLLASNCNRAGIPLQNTLELCLQHYDLNAKEVTAAVNSAYNHHVHEFATVANIANLQQSTEHNAEDYLKNTPAIPEELYHQMPDIIKQGALAFTDARERDVFLTGALGILSGCLPNVKGIYAQQEVYPNLFTFAIAPAASGKGALKFAKQLADEYHTQVLNASKEADIQFQQQDAAYKQNFRTLKKGETMNEEPPVKPKFKVVFIPANTSYAKILSHLEQNEGTGIICETEADTLGNVFKQEWGSYSDMLRKSFHHERLSSSRKTNNEFIEVNNPSLSIALSGTPSQVTGLIASAEDGLFSRFLFYAFEVEQIWKDVSPYGSQVNLTDHFSNLSLQVYRMVKFLKMGETNITLSKTQWQQLNHKCANWLQDITTFTGKDAASIVKRLGLILYRIAMLFSSVRKFENAEVAELIECTDIDFNTALQLAEIYLQHSILMFNNLPKQQDNTTFQAADHKRKFFEALPKEFTRAEAVQLGKQYKLAARSVDDMLHHAVPNLLAKPKPGYYQKL